MSNIRVLISGIIYLCRIIARFLSLTLEVYEYGKHRTR